jgi:hypothetical protein
MANHKLLLQILEKYGAPPKFVAAIERMYKDLVVVLKVGKELEEILQKVGVRQGENMAPVLFLFLMSAFSETLEEVWKEKGIKVVTVQTASEADFADGKGAIKSHNARQYMSRALSAFEILQCLYVNDGAFIFSTRSELEKGLDMIFCHFAKFGLEMHIERGDTKSKTECVLFTPPQFFDLNNDTPAICNTETEEWEVAEEDMLTDFERSQYESEKKKIERENVSYDGLEETQDIAVADGFVSFTRHFKYI